jgi:hypothetical protein
MDTVIIALAAVIGLLLLSVWGLVIQRSDLRQELDWTRQEMKRWRGEAEKLGWKNPFDACLDDLNRSMAGIKEAAVRLRQAQDLQSRNTEKLHQIAQTSKDLTAKYRTINDSLRQARAKLDSATAALPPKATGAANGTPVDVDEAARLRRIDEALRRFHEDVTSGRVKIDTHKLN